MFESPRVNRFINLAAFVITAVINGFGASGFFGWSQGEVADNNRIYLSPAGWAFSIWGVIYTFQAILLVWGPWCTLQSEITEKSLFGKGGVFGYFYLILSVCNSAWIIVFSQDTEVSMWISFVLILGLLVSLYLIYNRAYKALQISNGAKDEAKKFDMVSTYALWIGFTLYTAWVTVATFLQIKIALQKSGIVGSQNCSIGAACFICVVFFVVAILYRDPIFLFVGAWAFAAIGDESKKFNFDDVSTAAYVLVGIFAFFGVVGLIVGCFKGGLDFFFPPVESTTDEESKALGYDTTRNQGQEIAKVAV